MLTPSTEMRGKLDGEMETECKVIYRFIKYDMLATGYDGRRKKRCERKINSLEQRINKT